MIVQHLWSDLSGLNFNCLFVTCDFLPHAVISNIYCVAKLKLPPLIAIDKVAFGFGSWREKYCEFLSEAIKRSIL